MKQIHYDRERAGALVPLLEAIGIEIQERSDELRSIESEVEAATAVPFPDEGRVHGLVARAAAHRRGLRAAKQELERLGCSVVGTEPLTIRIPGRVGEAKHSFVWQTGDPILK